MFTPAALILCARLALLGGGVAVAVLMLGPFQGAEQALGLNDKAAHGLAFYLLTITLFLAAPRTRRTDLALFVFGLSLALEVVQATVGRSADLGDLALDAVGVGAALAPGLIERARHHARNNPYLTFSEIRAISRRRRQRRSRGAALPAPQRNARA